MKWLRDLWTKARVPKCEAAGVTTGYLRRSTRTGAETWASAKATTKRSGTLSLYAPCGLRLRSPLKAAKLAPSSINQTVDAGDLDE